MSIDACMTTINNNKHIVTIKNFDNLIQFFKLQLDTYKQCSSFISSFITLIDNLLEKQFSLYNNTEHIITIINNSISILYNNLIILFTKKYMNHQLFNLSTNSVTCPGYTVHCSTKVKGVSYNLTYFITSLRIQMNSDISYNMIKIVHNDKYNIPQSIILIGKKNINDNVEAILNIYKQSLIITLDKMKIYELSCICLINNLIDIILFPLYHFGILS